MYILYSNVHIIKKITSARKRTCCGVISCFSSLSVEKSCEKHATMFTMSVPGAQLYLQRGVAIGYVEWRLALWVHCKIDNLFYSVEFESRHLSKSSILGTVVMQWLTLSTDSHDQPKLASRQSLVYTFLYSKDDCHTLIWFGTKWCGLVPRIWWSSSALRHWLSFSALSALICASWTTKPVFSDFIFPTILIFLQ